MTTEEYYTLEVYGWAWGGFKSVYSYRVDTGTALALSDRTRKFRDDDARRCAGDFESLIDWRLVKCSHEYTRNRRVDTYKTLRGFRNGMRPARFYRIANGG